MGGASLVLCLKRQLEDLQDVQVQPREDVVLQGKPSESPRQVAQSLPPGAFQAQAAVALLCVQLWTSCLAPISGQQPKGLEPGAPVHQGCI